MDIPCFERDDTREGVNEAVVGGENLTVAPGAIRELVAGDPLKAGGELGAAAPTDVLDKRNPRRVVRRDANLPVAHPPQHGFD